MILDDLKMVQSEPTQDDFQGEDGLIHCGVCGEPKGALLPEGAASFFGRNHRPRPCACERKRLEELERQQREMAHTGSLIELRQSCFRSGSYGGATFKASTEDTEALRKCQRYVEHWDKVRQENLGLLLWGNVGTGKSYAAAAIANALIDQEVSVHMRNLPEYMNAGFEARSKLLLEIARPELLILDDFGVERSTEYGMETVFNVIDERYRSRKPLIVTTNLSLKVIQDSKADMAHARIYDRILEMCTPILFTGPSIRRKHNNERMKIARELLG